jgi:hypothetical protein
MHLSRLFRPSVSSVFSVGTLLALVVALLTAPLGAQTAKSRAQLYTDIDTNLPSTTGAITAAVLRTQLKNVVASAYNVVVADAQPLDSDLTAIAALTTTSFGRGLLTETSAATLKTTLALNLVANTADADKPVSTAQATAIAAAQAASQPLDADLTSIAALSTTAFGRSFLPLVDAAGARTLIGLGTLATQSGTFSGTSSGTNTGDNAVNSLYSGLVSNATHTGDATGSTALTLATVNANVGSFGSATAAPTVTVNAKGLITAAGSATITPAVGSITGLGTGIATALAINTGNSGAPVLIDGALGTPTSGVGTNLTALNATQLTSGTVPDARFPATLPAASGTNLTALNATQLTSGTVPAARFPPLTGEATTSAGAVSVTLTNSAVIGKVLTGYTSGAGTVAATDTILQAVQKLNGNDANLQPLDAELTAIAGISSNGLIARTSASTAAARTITGTAAEITVTNGDGVAGNPTLSLPTALTFTGKTVTGGTFASPTLTTPALGTPASGVVTNLTGTASININGTVGATTPSTGVFTGLTVNDNSTLGSSNTDTVVFNARVASSINPATDDTYDLGVTGHEWRNLNIDGTANIDSLVADTADINGGTIDGTAIGSGTASTGAFTTLSATGGISALGNLIALRTASNTTNSTTKESRWVGVHYNTAEEDMMVIYPFSTSTENTIAYGGGASAQNAATKHDFYVAPNNTTTTGTLVASISSTGLAVTGALSATGNVTLGASADGFYVTKPTSYFVHDTATAGNVYYGSVSSNTPVSVLVNNSVKGVFSSTGFAVTGALSASGKYTQGAGTGIELVSGDIKYLSNAGFGILSENGTRVLAVTNTGLAVTGQLALGGATEAASIRTTFTGNTIDGISLKDSADQSNAVFAAFRKADGTGIGSISRVTTTNAVSYNTTSDARLKTNIRDFTATDAARIIDGLRPRWFDWKSGDLTESVEETVDTGKKDKDGKSITEKRQKNQKVKDSARIAQHLADNKSIIGFIAQEEAAVDPALVRAGAVTVGDDDPTTISRQWARSDAALVPVLVAELKSLRARVAELEKANASLDARMAAVEALLKK